MKVLLSLFALCLVSCSPRLNPQQTLTAKGCNLDAVKQQSELYFTWADKKMKFPKGMFKTYYFETDTAILIEHMRADGDIRNWGGTYVVISKKTCTITSLQHFQ